MATPEIVTCGPTRSVEKAFRFPRATCTRVSFTVPVINARLAQVGYQGMPVETGIYPNPVKSLNILGKVDHQISGADQLSVRYALYDVTSSNARGVGNLNAPSGSTGLDNIDQSLAVGNVWTLSPATSCRRAKKSSDGGLTDAWAGKPL